MLGGLVMRRICSDAQLIGVDYGVRVRLSRKLLFYIGDHRDEASGTGTARRIG